MKLEEVLDKFFLDNESFDSNKELKELKKNYQKELSSPGCTSCKKRALKQKYTKLIKELIKL